MNNLDIFFVIHTHKKLNFYTLSLFLTFIKMAKKLSQYQNNYDVVSTGIKQLIDELNVLIALDKLNVFDELLWVLRCTSCMFERTKNDVLYGGSRQQREQFISVICDLFNHLTDIDPQYNISNLTTKQHNELERLFKNLKDSVSEMIDIYVD